ncbi:GRASP55/65 PDZ-like domain-containing protein [Trametes polyzona]|nr:GRASP55/65 PDZ-like domain-containing protein [Trametes polyzona]
MGASQSTASQTPSRALHVLRVTPSSPASQTAIEPYFDFVVGYQGDSFSSHNTVDASELERIVESHEGRTLNLLIWNSKSQATRVVPIVPSRDWSSPHANVPDPQEPEAERKPSLLGLSMRMCEPEFAMDNVWHVLDVLEGSPAESAGLVPYGDWIIGWSGGVLSAEGDFYDVVEAHIDKPLRVYVYSYDFDTIREVVLIPNRHWGGEGLLGCVFGFGLLHRIPPLPADREPGAIPPELAQDEADYEEQQLFVPADLPGTAETPEELEERLRWEQEEWERQQSYGGPYIPGHDPAYRGPSSYYGEPGLENTQHAHVHDADHAHSQPHDDHLAETPYASHSHSHDTHHHHDHDHDHASAHGNGYAHHDHGHGHSHDHDHGHDEHSDAFGHSHDHADQHEHEHDEEETANAAPPSLPQTPAAPIPRPAQRTPSISSPRASTPTPTRPFGAYMNGGSSRQS